RDVLEQAEERVLRPVDVVDLDDHGPLAGELLEQSASSPVDLVERELRVGEADGRRDPVTYVRSGRDERLHLRERRLRGGRVVDRGRVAHDFDERPEGDAASVAQAPAAQHARYALVAGKQLVREAALADAGVAEHRRDPALACRHRVGERRFEQRELLLAPDERTPRNLVRRNLRLPHAVEPEGPHTVRLALQLERLALLGDDVAAHAPVRRLTDQDRERRRRLLEPGGGVDGVTGDEALTRCRLARDDFAGVEPGPVRQPDAVAAVELLVEEPDRLLHSYGGAHGAQRVVLVDPRE